MKLLVKDVARLLAVPERTIYRWIKDGSMPAYRLVDEYRFNRAELIGWAAAGRHALSPEIFQDEDAGEAGLPRLTEALRAGGIHRHAGGADPAAVARQVVEVLPLPADADREFVHAAIVAREALGATAVGDGIAIPNVRHPIVLALDRPALALCFLESPIDLGAPDGLPIRALFALACPTVRTHLRLLSRLGFILCDPSFRRAVVRQDPPAQLIGAAERSEHGLGAATTAAP
jgi:nitrogen PTS system EIIA component